MGPIRVLHVDDDPAFAETAAALLEREDDRFEVETAAGAEEGERLLSASTFDCVVSDYDMPGRNGIEFLEAVRDDDPAIPFILFTGKGSEAVASEAISAGVTDYLQKGGGTEQYELLAHRITNAVDQHRTARRAETLDRVRTLVADVSRALVRAESRREIEEGVCEIISDADPYRFAWIGETAEETDRIEPRTSIGVQEGYLDEITVTADESRTGQGPAGRALQERRIAISQNVREDPGLEPWREAALERGFRAIAGVPLIHDGIVYGVLTVYADRTDAFDETERELLAELGDNVSYAIHSVRTRAERERTNTLLSTLLDVLPVGVLAEDADRNVLAANRRFLDLFDEDVTPDGIVGADCERFARDVADQFRDGDAFLERIESLIDAGEPVESEAVEMADGRILERGYEPVELPEGDGHLWVYRDVTDRAERERERRRRTEHLEELTARLETQYRYLFEQAPVMAVVTENRDGVPYVEDCDRLFAETLGYDKKEIVGRPLAEFYTDDSAAELREGGYERAIEGEFTREPRTIVTADGERVETHLRAVPRPDTPAEGGTLALYVDISERERIKRERDRLEEFTDIVSHDLRNPLSVAEGHLELARAERDGEHLEAVARAHDRMGALIGNLLALARAGERPDAVEPVELAAIAESCWRNVDTDDASIVVETGLTVEADRSRLSQLLENLFRNAIEHGVEDEGSVTVRVGDLDGGFYVEDDGVGFEGVERDRLFESGYSAAEEGTGLGLPIVRRIADAHGWDVVATENGSGGARFEFTGV